jgi:hypothetical protein
MRFRFYYRRGLEELERRMNRHEVAVQRFLFSMRMFAVFLYLALFLYVGLFVPLTYELIVRTGSLLITIEGLLLALTSQIPEHNRGSPILFAFVSLLLTLLTVVLADASGAQKVTDNMATIFVGVLVLFGITVEEYASAVFKSRAKPKPPAYNNRYIAE